MTELLIPFPFFLLSPISVTDDMDIRIANKFRLGRKIGGGSFGDIYLGESSSKRVCSIKPYTI